MPNIELSTYRRKIKVLLYLLSLHKFEVLAGKLASLKGGTDDLRVIGSLFYRLFLVCFFTVTTCPSHLSCMLGVMQWCQ